MDGLKALGLTLGGNARTGLEDTLYTRRGELARSNGALVPRLAHVIMALDRRVATLSDVKAALNCGDVRPVAAISQPVASPEHA